MADEKPKASVDRSLLRQAEAFRQGKDAGDVKAGVEPEVAAELARRAEEEK